jgi:hypothetical protein
LRDSHPASLPWRQAYYGVYTLYAILPLSRRSAKFAMDPLFVLTMHPHIIGQRSRIWIPEENIRLAHHSRASGS